MPATKLESSSSEQDDVREKRKSMEFPTAVPNQEPKKKKSILLSAADLLTMKFAPEQWIVGDLLRVDSKRMSLLLGQPRDGKSTLGMQLCVSVTQGKPFLGRPTM